MAIKAISRPRFEALCFMRIPTIKIFAKEREWYADSNENILGTVMWDKFDSNWSFAILGRDESARFRGIDVHVDFLSDVEARRALHEKMTELEKTGQSVFPQGLARKREQSFKLFSPVASRDKLNPAFILLSEGKGYSSARAILAEIAYTFEDPDGNYIQQFQTSGFDARLWELYIYALLHENDFILDRTYKAPDYVCMKHEHTIVLEATTVNPTIGVGQEVPDLGDPDGDLMADYMAIKLGSALFSKLKKAYWQLDHVTGRPLILAIADYQKPDGIFFSSKFLLEYLYGRRQVSSGQSFTYSVIAEHIYGNKTIPSGFFYQPDAENIAAVLFSDSGTISKFHRMGKVAGFGDSTVTMIRFGQRFDPARDMAPTEFHSKVDATSYAESWSEGIWLFHNPNAKHPVEPTLFPDAAHVVWEDEKYAFSYPDNFPVWSKTVVISSEEGNSSAPT